MAVQLTLHPRQGDAFLSPAREILYGGAAGGGKSYLMRLAAISWAYEVPNLPIYLFRRNFPDLEKNHLFGSTGFLSLLAQHLSEGSVKYNASKHMFTFWNGAIIYLCHLDNANALGGYQGAEIGALLVDELTQLTDYEYRYLRARVRLGSLADKIPAIWKGRFPRILCSANPGGVGHQWVKGNFIDEATPLEIRQMPPEEGGMTRQYIPARLSDNPTMETSYADNLRGLGSPEMVRAWLDGDWDIVAGAAFERLTRDTHSVRPFTLPKHWTRFMAMDWGTAKPFSIGWYAVVEGGTLVKAREEGEKDVYLPDGALVRYRELYGWNGRADEGCRRESYMVAQEILEIERKADDKMDYRIGDSAMWAQTDGPSPQERMYTETNRKFVMRQSEKDRMMNYQECRARVAGRDSHPMFFAFTTCHHFWRTVPTLQLDDLHPEKGPDTDMEDHCYDEWGYACRSRPFRTTRADRNAQEYARNQKKAGIGRGADPYRGKRA